MEMTRTLAMYLPQFHEIPENSKWWGEGFTEWTAVKKAQPYFPGHEQPVVPLNDNYYDLMSKDTMIWQADLAKKYGIDGFCFYHYWFGDSRKILEKPAENLLRWTDIDMPFCFSWDPLTWARSWSKFGNYWSDKFEHKSESVERRQDGILIQQDYGDEAYWKKHFEYLLPFFRDKRYIKLNEKPVFIFHQTQRIPCLKRMAAYWRRLAKKEGLPGLFLIGLGLPNKAMDAIIFPMDYGKTSLAGSKTIRHIIPGTSLIGVDYDEVWQQFLTVPASSTLPTMWFCAVSYDDSPRRGERGTVYLHVSPEKFQHYFGQLMRKSRDANCPFVFINAWNEWGEGMKLEPDTKTGYQYLEAVQKVTRAKTEELPAVEKELLEKGRQRYIEHLEYLATSTQKAYSLYRNWLRCKHERKNLSEYFKGHGWKKIALYGYGKHGEDFYREMQEDDEVEISYLIDVRGNSITGKPPIAVYTPDEKLPQCDVVVVSVIDEYEEILKKMQSKVDVPIVSLSEVVSTLKMNGY